VHSEPNIIIIIIIIIIVIGRRNGEPDGGVMSGLHRRTLCAWCAVRRNRVGLYSNSSGIPGIPRSSRTIMRAYTRRRRNGRGDDKKLYIIT